MNSCFICESQDRLTELVAGTFACHQHMNPPESQYPVMAALARAVNGDTP